MSNVLSLREYIDQAHNDKNNYKGSGLPKFQKFKPRIFPGKFIDTTPTIIESIAELNLIIQETYNHSINLIDIIKLFGEHNMLVSENLIVQLPVEDIDLVREYNRDRAIYSSRRTPEQYDELMEDIKINGIQQHGRIRLRRDDDYNIEAILGEGNHRLSIAKLLKLSTMPVRIIYTS